MGINESVKIILNTDAWRWDTKQVVMCGTRQTLESRVQYVEKNWISSFPRPTETERERHVYWEDCWMLRRWPCTKYPLKASPLQLTYIRCIKQVCWCETRVKKTFECCGSLERLSSRPHNPLAYIHSIRTHTRTLSGSGAPLTRACVYLFQYYSLYIVTTQSIMPDIRKIL